MPCASRLRWRVFILAIVLGLCAADARAQFRQQGSKLIGAGAVGSAHKGTSVALSDDGNTALVGGNGDNAGVGAAWVWTRSGGVWAQQGGKLVGTGAQGKASQGISVALSADGNTALVGGDTDNGGVGAVWVWTRIGGIWTQQGGKLAGTDAIGTAGQGRSVALSADGNTALIGGSNDTGGVGAAWVWARSGGVWTQQAAKLVGAGAVGGARQGISVALSADANTALVGGSLDNSNVGAVWAWTRSGGVWTQQGGKLVGTGVSGSDSLQGHSVAVSADGNTALVGGSLDNSNVGAVWAWTRNGGVWTQQGGKLVGTGAVGTARQGSSVALSASGNTALVGGSTDNGVLPTGVGATWVWTRSGGVWTQQSAKLVGAGAVGSALQGTSAALSAGGHTALIGGLFDNSEAGAAWVFVTPAAPGDVSGDETADILWRHVSGETTAWFMLGTSVIGLGGIVTVDPSWQIVGTRDFNADGRADLLWRHTSGAITLWLMNGPNIIGQSAIGTIDPGWQIVGTGDYNFDGRSDILWRHTSGAIALWLLDGTSLIIASVFATIDPGWQIVGTGDYNGDGRADILWRHAGTGDVAVWLMNAFSVLGSGGVATVDASWQIVGTADYNADGRADILWRHTSGALTLWLMNGTGVIGGGTIGTVDPAWQVRGSGDYDRDGHADILWRHSSGAVTIWLMDSTQIVGGGDVSTVDPGWRIVPIH